MKFRIVLLILLLMMVIQPGFGQETSKKAKRLKAKMEKIQYIDSLANSKTFRFVADRALPQGWKSVDLTTNYNFLKFDPELTESYMPYFGRAYSADYGGEGGIKFKSKPSEYIISKAKNGFEINVTVSDTHDMYKLPLFVSPEGSASLNINCNQKSSISYLGEIVKNEKPVEKIEKN